MISNNVVDSVKGLQGTKRIAHHLAVAFSLNKNSKTMLVVDDLQNLVGNDDAVAGSKAILYPAGEVEPLFDEHHRVSAVLLCRLELFQYIGTILLGAVLHLSAVIANVRVRRKGTEIVKRKGTDLRIVK